MGIVSYMVAWFSISVITALLAGGLCINDLDSDDNIVLSKESIAEIDAWINEQLDEDMYYA